MMEYSELQRNDGAAEELRELHSADDLQSESTLENEAPEAASDDSAGNGNADDDVGNEQADDTPEANKAADTPEDKLHAVPSRYQRDVLIERIVQKKRYRRTLTATITVLAFIAAVAVLIALVFCPVIKISGSGMEPTYKNGDILVLLNLNEYEVGELCCISYQNKLIVKRVIAKGGDSVSIDENGNVFVNGVLLDEPYASNKCLGECNIEFPLVVPAERYFVMGDRRDTSIDSRSTLVGCVGEEDILGRVLIKVWPFDGNQ